MRCFTSCLLSILASFCIECPSSMAAHELVEVKTFTGDTVLVHTAELKLAYKKAFFSNKLETNCKGFEENDDGSVTIRVPNFRFDGRVWRLGYWDSETLLGTCKFFGFTEPADKTHTPVPLGEHVVLLNKNAELNGGLREEQVGYNGARYSRLFYNYIDTITCR